ncbi:MAG TPA: diacylglycerol kinase family protein [Ktedonobacterales bacterium]|nr:diacylglycerol kinase family protein [Ktedonobacterales bacterium]
MHESAHQTGEGAFAADALESALRRRGLDGEVIALGAADDLAAVAERAALDGARVVVAVGGDGTIHDVARGLWRASRAGAGAALGILPAGTMNNIAAALGVPMDADAALDGVAETLRTGRFRPLDLARIGDTIFIEAAGFGMLSELMGIGESVKQNSLAAPAAAIQVGQALARYQPAPLTLRLDGRAHHFHALHVLLCNAPAIAMRMNVAPGARMDDGLLDVVVYERFRPLELLAHVIRRIGGRRAYDQRVRRYRARSVVVEPDGASSRATWAMEVDGHVDGDCGPEGRWRRIEAYVLPHALRLAALPAPARLEARPWRTAWRALASMLKRSPAKPPSPAAVVAAGSAALESAVRDVTEPPRRAARRAALIRTLYLGAAGVAVATGVAARRASILPGDLAITQTLQRTRSARMDRFWRGVAWAGFPGPATLVISGITLALWRARFHLEALYLLLAGSVSGLNFVLKRIVRRERPTEPRVRVLRLIREPSFPSGHVMFYVSSLGFLVAAALANLRPSALRRAITAAGGSLIALVGASRVYLGAHWPSDVVAGYLIGAMYLGGVLELYWRAKSRQAEAASRALPKPTANELATAPDIGAADANDPRHHS